MNAFDLTTFFLKQKNFSNNCGNQHGFGMPGRYPSFTNWLLPTHSKLLFVRNLSNDLFFEVKIFSRLYILYTYVYESSLFSIRPKIQIQSKILLTFFFRQTNVPFTNAAQPPPIPPPPDQLIIKRLTNEIDKKWGWKRSSCKRLVINYKIDEKVKIRDCICLIACCSK